MDDYDYLDEVYQGAGGFDVPSFDLADAFSFGDLSGITNQIDLADAFSFGDLSGLSSGFDYGEMFGDLSGISGGIEGFGDVADTFGGSLSGGGLDLSGVFDPTDISDYLTNTDAEAQEGGFYGNTDSAYYDPRTNTTTLYNPDGTVRDTIVHYDLEGVEREYDAEKQPGGFYGNTPNATYDPKTNITTIRDNNGNITRQIPGPPIPPPPPGPGPGPGPKPPPGPGPDKTPTPTPPPGPRIPDWLKGLLPSKDNAMLYALLGGLLGLLNRGSGTKAPVGYQGSIPKYTAVRGPAASPTAGGRRPGGAGIGSLAGTTKYVPAAAGGLMDLAVGGQPARYLRGGTDGMADKIKTDIDGKQPARLSHGEFVIPADVVSHLGNGNSDAGADVLYDMMAKVRKARTGNSKQGKQINPRKYTPA